MASPGAPETLAVLFDLTQSPNREVIAAEPGLTWLLPTLDAEVVRLTGLVGNVPAEDATRDVRAALSTADGTHDDGHRFVFGLLSAFENHGSPEARRAVGITRRALYPTGLAGTQIAYRREVAEAQPFQNRARDPKVTPGLAIVSSQTPALSEALTTIAASVETMRALLSDLADVESKASAAPRTRELFDARNAAMSTLATFAQIVEYTLRGDEPARAEKRERLLHRWRHALADAAARESADDDLLRPPIDALAPSDTPSPDPTADPTP